MSWLESLVDDHIRRAAERGDFDDLPGSGRPIPGLDRPYGPGWWARQFVERERLAEAAREELDDIDRALGEIWPLPSESRVRSAVRDLNLRIEALNAELPAHRRAPPFEFDEIVDLWRRFGIGRRRT